MQFILNHWELFAALAAVVVLLLVTSSDNNVLAGYQNTEPHNAVPLMNNSALVLDLRSPEEYQSGYLLHSIHIPMADLPARLNELGKKHDKPVLLVSSRGKDTAAAAKLLRAQGFANIQNLKGGIQAWRAAQLPLQKGGSANA